MGKELYGNYYKFYSEGVSGDLEKICSYYDDDYKKFLPEDKNIKILDIGCGMGHFLYYLSKKGYKNIKGIDICQEQVDAAKKIVPGDIRQIPDLKSYFAESGETFDMITMNDVLEHLDKKEILETLKMVRTSLNPSGVFICRVPNMSNIFGVYLFYNDFTHEAAFTEYSIGQILGLAGFEDINVYGNVTHINSSWKRALFNIAAKIIAAMTKLILAYIYMPGSRQPGIMTTFLMARGKNINKERA